MRLRNAVLAVCAAAMLATGCGRGSGGKWPAGVNSVYVTEEQAVESVLVYTSEQFNDLYDQEELAAFVGQAVSDYVAEHGTVEVKGESRPPVSMRSCSLEGQTGTVVFTFASPEDFVEFAKATGDDTHSITSLSVRTVSEERRAGNLSEEIGFVNAKGKAVSTDEVAKRQDYKVVIVEGAGTICTEGKIAYTSQGTAVSEDGHTAVTDGGRHFIVFK